MVFQRPKRGVLQELAHGYMSIHCNLEKCRIRLSTGSMIIYLHPRSVATTGSPAVKSSRASGTSAMMDRASPFDLANYLPGVVSVHRALALFIQVLKELVLKVSD